MGRSRSRSPRKKERRRSKSKERLDKFGRDVGRSERRPQRDEPRKKEDVVAREDLRKRNDEHYSGGRDYFGSTYQPSKDNERYESGYRQPPPPPFPPSGYVNRHEQAEHLRQRGKDLQPVEDDDDDAKKIQQLMGFTGFVTTKNKHVEGNADGCSKINKPRKFRQYMNRRGGFNRPLDWVQ
uniref:U4/U6.U5 small nuclear ribonucleoprotein 27 kDa protein n=1 Tax=Hydra vulgaris TaxID=6087 RepID=T2M817_HYDVU